MRDSLLGQIYFTLPAAERKGLREAIQAPPFNQRSEVVRLLDFLEKFANGSKKAVPLTRRQPEATLSKEAAYAYIFNGEKTGRRNTTVYDDGKMRHLMSYALQAIRQYLAWDDWHRDTSRVSLHWCRALKRQGLNQQFDKDQVRAIGELESGPYRSTDYFYYRYALELESWEQFSAVQRSGAGNLEAVGQSFAAFVAINTLRQGCAALAQKAVSPQDLQIPYLAETLAKVEQGAFAGNPAVETYYYSYQALSNPDQTAFFNRLEAHIQQYGAIFPDNELGDLYILAINFCIRRLNTGDRQYIQKAFDLYRAGLERKVFLENGYLSRYSYRNILNLALALNEWDWALEYLQTFAAYLDPRERDNVYHYNLATYYFRRPDYEKALDLLRRVEFRDVLHNFDARRMLLRIYYARREWQALDSLLDSFSVYLQRHRETGYHRDMYRNLVRFVKRLLQLRSDDSPGRARLRTDIERAEHVAERDWLLGQI